MRKSISILTFSFILFLGFVIYSANTGHSLVFFEWVSALPMGDKLGHFSLMFVFSLLLNMMFKHRKLCIKDKNVLIGSLVVFILITLEEVSQIALERRTFDFMDLLCNYLGIACSSLTSLLVIRKRSKKVIKFKCCQDMLED
jgi:glycopeptide antibiotics resistance protein